MNPLLTLKKHFLPGAVVLLVIALSCTSQKTSDSGQKDSENLFFVANKELLESDSLLSLSETAQKIHDAVSKAECKEWERAADGTCLMRGIIDPNLLVINPPRPCPQIQCDEMLGYVLVCFFSQPDERPVLVYLNENSIGEARQISYDQNTKMRTVELPTPENTKEGDIMKLEIPVTTGNGRETVMTVTAKYR